jgi:hypothetical protein
MIVLGGAEPVLVCPNATPISTTPAMMAATRMEGDISPLYYRCRRRRAV